MNLHNVLKVLSGGVLVHVVMAACAGAESGSGDGGSTARAQVVTVTSVTETCGASNQVQHAYPGKSKEELAFVRVLLPQASFAGTSHTPSPSVFVGDGVVASSCQSGASVIFVSQ